MAATLSLVPRPVRYIPTENDIRKIPLARGGEFDLSDKEIIQTRRLVYSINRQGVFLYRTIRQGSLLMIWRIK